MKQSQSPQLQLHQPSHQSSQLPSCSSSSSSSSVVKVLPIMDLVVHPTTTTTTTTTTVTTHTTTTTGTTGTTGTTDGTCKIIITHRSIHPTMSQLVSVWIFILVTIIIIIIIIIDYIRFVMMNDGNSISSVSSSSVSVVVFFMSSFVTNMTLLLPMEVYENYHHRHHRRINTIATTHTKNNHPNNNTTILTTTTGGTDTITTTTNNNNIITPYYIPTVKQIAVLSNDDTDTDNNNNNKKNVNTAERLYEETIQQFVQSSSTWPSGGSTTTTTSSSSSVLPKNRVIHIVKTRFMQEQSTLVSLNEARILLFRIFTIPTMVQQTQQNFIWFIKVDPLFHNTIILQTLIDTIRQHMIYNNTYIIGSNRNYRINEHFPGSFRDGIEIYQDLVHCKFYTGDQQRLELALSLYEAPIPILETRLDADDGLHIDLLHTIQMTALTTFRNNPHVQWMYYCCRRHMEWHWIDPLSILLPSSSSSSSSSVVTAETTTNNKTTKTNRNRNRNTKGITTSSSSHHHHRHHHPNDTTTEFVTSSGSTPLQQQQQQMLHHYGTIQGVTHTNLCITPGITTAYNSHTRETTVPVFAHDELVKKIKFSSKSSSNTTTTTNHSSSQTTINCGYTNSSYCLQFIETFLFEAIRSRTPTSAGMLQIQPNQIYDQIYIHYMFWNMLHRSFTISRQQIKYLQDYLSNHLIEIAQDNLIGQCTTGHSCKDSAKYELQQLIASRSKQQQQQQQ